MAHRKTLVMTQRFLATSQSSTVKVENEVGGDGSGTEVFDVFVKAGGTGSVMPCEKSI